MVALTKVDAEAVLLLQSSVSLGFTLRLTGPKRLTHTRNSGFATRGLNLLALRGAANLLSRLSVKVHAQCATLGQRGIRVIFALNK